MSAFDADTFLSQEYKGKLDEVTTPVPAGIWTGIVEKYGVSQITRDDGSEPLVLEITWSLDDVNGDIKKVTRRNKNTVRQSIWIEDLVSGANGVPTLDYAPGANVNLGRFLGAVGLNTGKGSWSWSQLMGRTAKVEVFHNVSKKDGQTYANVRSISKL